jgi:hypothetical protein
MAERPLDVGDAADFLYSPMTNSWNGNETLELRIRDFRPSGSPAQ